MAVGSRAGSAASRRRSGHGGRAAGDGVRLAEVRRLEPAGDASHARDVGLHDARGALLEVLAEFALRGINLTRIESRPMKARLGEYQFFLDCEGHVAEEAVGDTMAELRRRCTWVRFLGSYPRVGAPRPGPDPAGFAAAKEWLSAVRAGQLGLAVVAVACSVVSAFFYMRIAVLMYMSGPAEPSP